MKAKDYAREYQENRGTTDDDNLVALAKVAHAVIFEMKEILHNRNPKKSSALLSIFKEQENKWRAFIRRIENHNLKDPDMFFRYYMESQHPDIFESWWILELKQSR